MAKALRHFPPDQRTKVAIERSKGVTKGLTYLAALDYLQKVKRGQTTQ